MIEWSKKQADFIRKPFKSNLEVNEGTPRSGKTTAGVFRFARYLVESPDLNHLVVGYNQEQAYRLFFECDGFGLLNIFGKACRLRHDDGGDHLEIKFPNGVKKKVYYKGGGKADSYKSILGMSFGAVAFCEINVIHMDMIQECFRRTMAAKLRWHLADLNPPSPHHPVIEDVFEAKKADWLHWTIDDNPVITNERKMELFEELSRSPYLFKRDWLGERVLPTGLIYSLFEEKEHIKSQLEGDPVEMFFTADGGQDDATSCSCNIVTRINGDYRLYRVANYYHSGKDTGNKKAMSVYAKELRIFIQHCENKFNMKHELIMVDPACLSLREELREISIDCTTANNNGHELVGGKRGIEVGIERCQNVLSKGLFFLLEAEKYSHANYLKEISMYCRDDNGNPVDAYNHALDEWRYAVNYFYRAYL